MTSDEINDLFGNLGVSCRGVVVDSQYSLPTRAWFLDPNARALKKNLELLGASQYVPDKNDCDDFAIVGAMLSRLAHNVSTTSESGLAVGVVFYEIDNNGGAHAIEFAIVREDGEHKVIFFEPQTQSEVALSPTEIASIFFYYV